MQQEDEQRKAFEAWRETAPWYVIAKPGDWRDKYSDAACTFRLMNIAASQAWDAALTQSVGREWQPIETAPKDGVFLVYMPTERVDDRMHTAKWHPNAKVIGGCFAFDRPPVTHWQPLPPSPTSGQEGSNRA